MFVIFKTICLQDDEIITDLHNTVFNLEASLRTQQDIDISYNNLTTNLY